MQSVDIEALNQQIYADSAFIEQLNAATGEVIVGQEVMLQRLLIGLLAGGHVLLEGLPGLAKTLAIKTLSKAVQADYQRIQFTPDLLPADIIGTMIYNPTKNDFTVRKGPIFANFILADEINRAPAKVQSALLEAMQERQVTIGGETFKLEEPFPGASDSEPHRARRYLSPARGPDRSLHAQGADRLPYKRRRTGNCATQPEYRPFWRGKTRY
jgi:MoxR-like ATPase